MIKSPNKTAVKLFLVPYDLSDMEPGQKTFIRQRSYSAGPIIDMPLSSRTNLGTDRPEAALSASNDPNDRPMLRYLLHLHICCPSKGRYFLYKSIRVVFANRVPDGKEKLRNEIQLPEPRYSAYKPGRDSYVGVAAGITPKDALRRRSVADTVPAPSYDEPPIPQSRAMLAKSLPMAEYNPAFTMPAQHPFPYYETSLPGLEPRSPNAINDDRMDIDLEQSQESYTSSKNATRGEAKSLTSTRQLDDPFSFDRDRSRERKPNGRSESLLSRRLKDLAFQAARSNSDS